MKYTLAADIKRAVKEMKKQIEKDSESSAAAGSVPCRLLKKNEVIQSGDMQLLDDCATWEKGMERRASRVLASGIFKDFDYFVGREYLPLWFWSDLFELFTHE